MRPIRTTLLLLALCVYGALSVSRQKRSILDTAENPSDLHEALRVLERERRRFQLHAADEVLPQEGIQFQDQPIIVDNQGDSNDDVDEEDEDEEEDSEDAGSLNDANSDNLLYYGPEQARDVQSLMREIEEDPLERTGDRDRRLNSFGLSDAKDDLALNNRPSLDSDYKRLYKKYAKKMAKRNYLAPEDTAAVQSAFNNLTPEEIKKIILLAGNLQNEEVETNLNMDDLTSDKKRDRKRGNFEDADVTNTLSHAELQDLIQNNAMSDDIDDSTTEDGYRSRQFKREMENEPGDNLIVDDQSNSDLMEMSISDLAKLDKLQRLQKQFMKDIENAEDTSLNEQDENKDESYLEKDDAGNGWAPQQSSMTEDLVPVSDSLQGDDEVAEESSDFNAENQEIGTPDIDLTDKMQYPMMSMDENPRMNNMVDDEISLARNSLSNEGENDVEEEENNDDDDEVDNEEENEEEEEMDDDVARYENAKSLKEQELSNLAALNAEEERQEEAALNFRLMLDELDKENKLRNRLLEEEAEAEEEEEEEEEEAEEEAEERRREEETEKECPLLSMTGNCQFADVLKIPFSSVTRDLCNRHAMCYNCGSSMRLGPTVCDRGFLADSIKSCDNDIECMREANTFLSLMKVAHKYNSTPNRLCEKPCVRDYVIGL
ncbi:ABC transporter F family member 4 isoform X3 [Octopus bimaculoides]|uniref:ABC transporter F family member 4 isoform X3 n=1 Tax=Octopus bimaculoides TaxID=37653 RepID=UPI00071D9225|nr:ABC transporter F family member 4 isoform X3 [Octopus bimaculoides]|eukprot:XP_014779197.1 PREDICTED: ABC transporter F family member 4-like isoform X2 [Octopus bimaculoides]